MPSLRVAFLGDVFASTGRRALEDALPRLRSEHAPDLIVVNAENAAHGSGLTPDQYRQLRKAGVDGITLGDHAYRDGRIVDALLAPDEPICRPANFPDGAPGKRSIRLAAPQGRRRDLVVVTVLGRVFMHTPADNPFGVVDRILAGLESQPVTVLVEAHMEATSEKAALAHHLDGRVAAVLGTHTHVPTADARILPGGTAFITDVGMCGPWDSCIGRDKRDVVRYMSSGLYGAFGIGAGDERACGVLLDLSDDTGLAIDIRRVEYAATPSGRVVR